MAPEPDVWRISRRHSGYLRAISPGSKDSFLGVVINSLQCELGVVRSSRDRYVLPGRGEADRKSHDPSDLAGWLLRRILGVDTTTAALRDRRPVPHDSLEREVQALNPGWPSSQSSSCR